MKVVSFRGLRGVATVDKITQAVLYDDLGQPLMIISSPAAGVIITSQVGDENFGKMLNDLKLTEAIPKVRNA